LGGVAGGSGGRSRLITANGPCTLHPT